MDQFLSSTFLFGLLQIVMIDLLLGGDNAVVIGLACRRLSPRQRLSGIVAGTAGAIVIRVVLIFFALRLLEIPYLKLLGGALLFWIAIKLLLPQEDDDHQAVASSDRLWSAVRTIVVADVVMSLDNVVAIAGAADSAGGAHKMPLVVLGLLISIPIIVAGSRLVLVLMDRFPVVITLGAMLLGWIAGTMGASDQVLVGQVPMTDTMRYACGAVGALLVLATGRYITARSRRASGTSA